MILLDTTVLVYAARREFELHRTARDYLGRVLVSQEPVAVLDEVLAATSRLLTNHRVFATPASGTDALDFCRRIREAPAATVPAPTARRWQIFAELVESLGLRGNDIPDALLAASAVDQGAVLATFDRGFRRFPRVEVRVPQAG